MASDSPALNCRYWESQILLARWVTKDTQRCKPPKIPWKSTDYQQLLKWYLSIQENWKVEKQAYTHNLDTCICTCTVHTYVHSLTHTTYALEILRRKDLFGTLMFYARSLPFLLWPCPSHTFPTPISFDTNALLKILKSKLWAQNSCNSQCKSTCVLFFFPRYFTELSKP